MMVCELRVGEVKRRVSESGGMVVKYELVDDWKSRASSVRYGLVVLNGEKTF